MAEERQPQWMRDQERERIGAQALLPRREFYYRPPDLTAVSDTPARVIAVIMGLLATWTLWHVIRWAQAGYLLFQLNDGSWLDNLSEDGSSVPWWIRDPIGEPFPWFVAPVLGLLFGLGVYTLVRGILMWWSDR